MSSTNASALSGGDFPYESADAFVDDILEELEEKGHI